MVIGRDSAARHAIHHVRTDIGTSRTHCGHEAGIHQDGVLKQRDTYEIMRAEDVGWSANQIVLGKHSCRTAFRNRMSALDIEFESDAELNAAFGRFKELADKKHDIFDDDLSRTTNRKVLDIQNRRIVQDFAE